PLTKVLLKNGDQLQGVLETEDIEIALDVGPKVKIYQDRIDVIYAREGYVPEGLPTRIKRTAKADKAFRTRLKDRNYGWLGVLIQDVSNRLAKSFGLERPVGALIAKIVSDSPAERAGLQVGDVIIEYNEHTIKSSADLPPLVMRTGVGEVATLKVLREGKAITLKVIVGKLPEELAQNLLEIIERRLAIVVTDLTERQKKSSM
ncbi:PDZ domain-containing protein, partial [Candidatus Parcubacteria bacterium]